MMSRNYTNQLVIFFLSALLSVFTHADTTTTSANDRASSQSNSFSSQNQTNRNTIEWHYTIRPKDNIWTIGEQFLNRNHEWGDIIRHNNIRDPKTLTAGTTLRIPVNWLKRQPVPAIAASVTGNNMVRRHLESNFTPLEKNDSLHVGDEITTHDGSVLIRFADKSILRLEPKSNLIFNRLTRYGKTGMADTRLRLQKGRLSTQVTPLNHKNSRYEINTPSAVAAVRGTGFRLFTDNNVSQLEVTEGSVDFSSLSRSFTLNSGEGIALTAGRSNSSVVDLPEALTPKSNITQTKKLPITLSWVESPKVVTYYYQLFKGSEEGELLDSSFLQKPEVKLNHLTNGTYLVAMRAVNDQGFSGLDSSLSVVIGMIAEPSTLLAPANDATINNDMPEFTWKYNSTNELSQLQIAKDISFSELVSHSEYAQDNTSLPDSALEPGLYHWRVQTLAGGDNTAFSDTRRLKITGELPPSKIISVNYIGNQVKIYWNTVPQAESYVLQLAEDSEFKNILHEEARKKSNASVKITAGKQYYARVKGIGNEYYSSTFSAGKEIKLQ